MSSHQEAKARVQIMGQEYVIKGNDPPEYMEMLAKFVSEKMEQVNRHRPAYGFGKVAVLVALQLADELSKLRDDYEKMIEELKVLDKIHKNG